MKEDLNDTGILKEDFNPTEGMFKCCRCGVYKPMEERWSVWRDMDDISKHHCDDCEEKER